MLFKISSILSKIILDNEESNYINQPIAYRIRACVAEFHEYNATENYLMNTKIREMPLLIRRQNAKYDNLIDLRMKNAVLIGMKIDYILKWV